MKTGKASGPSAIVAEVFKTSVRARYNPVTHVTNKVNQEGVEINDWCSGIIASCYKGKGDALKREVITKEIKLLGQVVNARESVYGSISWKKM